VTWRTIGALSDEIGFGRIEMRRKLITCLLLVFCCLLTSLVMGSSTLAQVSSGRQEYTGSVVGIGGQFGAVTRSFTLVIERFTATNQARRDALILREQGQDALLNAIHKERLGYFALEGQTGRDLNFVHERNLGDGRRRIVAVFERWLNMYELRYGTRSEDYPFTYIELIIDSNGKGEGTLIPAARIHFDSKNKNQVDVENFGIYPARLVGVQLRNKS